MDQEVEFILFKDMLENDKKPTRKSSKHIDRCLSCY